MCACIFLQDERGAVVLSGCGTSGRLGFITAVSFKYFQPWYYFGSFSLPPLRLHHHTHTLSCVQRSFNQLFPGKFHYTIAGGDRALLLSTEAPEDSWQTGVDDLEKVGSTQFLTWFIFFSWFIKFLTLGCCFVWACSIYRNFLWTVSEWNYSINSNMIMFHDVTIFRLHTLLASWITAWSTWINSFLCC